MEKTVTIKDVIREANGTLIQGNENLPFENLCRDTRIIKQGEIYLGIQGENFNGSTLYEEALQNGAVACILQDNVEIKKEVLEKYPTATIVVVENTVKALQKIATYKRSLYDIPVVAITGSVGKTSTKDMIAEVIAQKYNVLKTQGNYNNEIGVPLTILRLKDEDAMVVEMGMSSLGEISLLTNIAKPDVAVITNIGTAHIGNLGSRENILKAKLEILEGLNPNGTVVINYDNDLLHKWYEEQKGYNVITYGLQEGSNVVGKNVEFLENGSKCQAIIDNEAYDITIPVGGEHFVQNSLCAMAVAKALQIPMEKAANGIAKFELTKKRMEIKKAKCGATIVNDCYNANYDSMKAALEYLGKLSNERKIAVLGDMLELGEFSEELHRKVGKEVYKNKVDLLICVGKEAVNIAKGAEKEGFGNNKVYLCKENEEAIKILQDILTGKDVVLLKASNGLNFTQICEAIV